VQKIFTKLNEALASAKALLHASRHVAESGSVALQQHRMCAVLESSVKERGKVYFADSYCSWQKGAIENANKFIRKYITKKANFDDFSDRRIMEIQKKLNRRPREKIDFDTLKDRFFKFFSLTLHYLLIR